MPERSSPIDMAAELQPALHAGEFGLERGPLALLGGKLLFHLGGAADALGSFPADGLIQVLDFFVRALPFDCLAAGRGGRRIDLGLVEIARPLFMGEFGLFRVPP